MARCGLYTMHNHALLNDKVEMRPEWNSARAIIGVANQLLTYDDQIQDVKKINFQSRRHLQMFGEPIWGQYLPIL